MLNLILGGAGCGKTHLITEMIKKDVSLGQRAILLVPEQETVARERAMLEQLSPSAQLTFEVMNFTRLANSVFRKYGGLTYNYVSAPLKALAMWNTLRQLSPLLKEYGGQSEDVEFSAMMLSQIEEFKAYGISPTALERAADKAQEKTKTKAKLEDMSLIYAAYSAALASFGAGDASDDIAKLAEKLREHDFFQNTNVYIDSFTSFTASEEQVLLQIMRTANSVSIALCIPCEGEKSGLQFECVAGTLGRIERLAEKCACPIERTVLRGNRRTKNNALLYLSENIWSFNSDVFDEACEGIELIKCTNTYEEAEAACTAISKLVREGMRYRDIVVLARNIKSYEGIIDSALEKADIPYFISKTDDVTSMPLSKLLLSALRIKNSLWRTEDIITYIKTGLTGIDERAADLFEQYIWKWSISGAAFLGDDWTMDPDSYSPETSEKNREILRKINEARFALIAPLKRLFEKIDAAVTNRDICRGIFEYMEELSIAQKLRNFAERCRVEGNPAMASENLQLYNSVLDVLSILAEFDMGEERFNSADLEVALRIVLARTGLGVIPTSCDEVSIGSASLMRADSPRCVILIGVNDGVFPENVEENRMLSDEEKQFLALYGIELSGGKEERSSEELFYVYRAISAPSERLIMTYAASELQGGKEIR
ncbi:MAG: exodeoxyribonuclease V subunit gamma, partial [Clostridia bacterium]|nr:exodeoxyribonuclease V subunit gamma [Clostridia bacterium]